MASTVTAAQRKVKEQRAVFDFFVNKFTTGEPFTKQDVAALTTWKPKTLGTYWSKQLKAFIVPAGSAAFRVSEAFRHYATWETFQAHVTQVRAAAAPDYSLLQHDAVLVYEFFMPLTNETQLRTSLDTLFYYDTILKRLRALDGRQLRQQFPGEPNESEEEYLSRLCDWVSKKFLGYSISTVSGRFRVEDMLSMAAAAEIGQKGRRYLIDETTAIVRFIFPCGKPLRRPPPEATEDFVDPEPVPPDEDAIREAQQVRWLFKALFVRTIIQVVNAEAEIWMVESGMRNRLHIWKVMGDGEEGGQGQGDAEADTGLFEGAEPDDQPE